MTIKKWLFSVAAIFVAMLLFGCGGGSSGGTGSGSGVGNGSGNGSGSGSGSGADSPSPAAPPQTPAYRLSSGDLRAFSVGDSLSYATTVTGAFYDGSSRFETTGQTTVTFAQSSFTIEGVPPLLARASRYSDENVTSVFTDWVHQDPNGTMSIHYDSDQFFYNYPRGSTEVRSPIGVGSSWANAYLRQDVTQTDVFGNYLALAVNESFTVIGTDTVTTSIGRFETFEVVYSRSIRNDSTSGTFLSLRPVDESGTMWIHPAVGIVKWEATEIENTFGGDFTTVGSFVLESTNIALSH